MKYSTMQSLAASNRVFISFFQHELKLEQLPYGHHLLKKRLRQLHHVQMNLASEMRYYKMMGYTKCSTSS